MVEGGADQAHQPRHVPEDLIPKKPDGTGGARFRPVHSRRLVSTVRIRASPLPGLGSSGPISLFNGRSTTLRVFQSQRLCRVPLEGIQLQRQARS